MPAKKKVEGEDKNYANEPTYTKYGVKIRLREKLLGGWPKSLKAELAMMEARARQGLIPESMVDETRKKFSDAQVDAETAADDAAKSAWCGFQVDPQGRLAIHERALKAMFKENSKVLRLASEPGYRGSLQDLQHAIFVKFVGNDIDPTRDWWPLGKEPHGFVEHVVQVMTMQGPRSSIKRHDYFEKVEIDFEIWVITKSVVDQNFVERALELAQEGGIGAARSQGYGKFDVIGFSRLPDKVEERFPKLA